ncbi:MAG: porin family protein [Brucellaceae bacterium]|nr:porin family protein [Brucellaceae bacterium]
MASSAFAADPQEPADGYQWSGFYVGFGGGAGAIVHQLDIPILAGASFNGIGGEGVFGELTIGYDHVFNDRYLLGVMIDGRLSTIATRLNVPGIVKGALEADYGFDVVARAGYLINPRTLGYVLGGYSWQHFDITSNLTGSLFTWDSSGFTVGAGLETAVSDRMTMKAEYRYSQYAGQDFGLPGIVDLIPSTHTVHVGLNYRFNGNGAAPASFASADRDWTGFYAMAGVGAGAVVHEVNIPILLGTTFNGIGGEGIFGELGVGYDREFSGGWVAGVQVSGRLASTATTLSVAGFNGSVDADYGVDAVVRVGKKMDGSTLAYVLGGWSMQHFDVTSNLTGSVYKWTGNGFTVGAGLETAMSDRLAVGVEYRYSGYEGENFGLPGIVEVNPSSHAVRLNLKYKAF